MAQPEPSRTPRMTVRVAGSIALAGTAAGLASEFRLKRQERPVTDRWQTIPVTQSPSTVLGISFRPRQAEMFDLEPIQALRALLEYPFQVIRLGAYWNRIEPEPDHFDPCELDWQVDAAEATGKQIIICIGPVKCFGYPEYFVPNHILRDPLPERSVISPSTHPSLLAASTAFAQRIVERYRHRESVIAWQVEHEAVDPLGMEHSWRLSTSFVRAEVNAVRAIDPSRPVILNGFLPTSTPVRLSQAWRTRYQGDSLTVACRLADIVGVDFYPRHALFSVGSWSAYLDGVRHPWHGRRWRQLAAWTAETSDRLVMITEAQAEPWEAATVPPSPANAAMYSCLPEAVISNYNKAIRHSAQVGLTCTGYLFWGAEYWLLREAQGDSRYLEAFTKVLGEQARRP